MDIASVTVHVRVTDQARIAETSKYGQCSCFFFFFFFFNVISTFEGTLKDLTGKIDIELKQIIVSNFDPV